MSRLVLLAIAAAYLLTGVYILVAPRAFYDAVPGLSAMGPYNAHFIRDVAFAFVASGGALGWGAWRQARGVALAGAAWPLLHAFFHVQIWTHRGLPFDGIAAFDLGVVVTPAFLAAWAATRLETLP